MRKNTIPQPLKLIFALAAFALLALLLGFSFRAWFIGSSAQSVPGEMVAQAKENESLPALPVKTPTQANPEEQTDYLPVSQTRDSRGISVTVSNFSIQKNQASADFCYKLPGEDYWVGLVTLNYGGFSTSDLEARRLSFDEQTNGLCERLTFMYIKENLEDFDEFIIVVPEFLMIPPLEGRECETYLARIEANEKVKQAGLQIKCETSLYGTNLEIVQKSQSMTMQDAESLLNDAMHNTTRGD